MNTEITLGDYEKEILLSLDAMLTMEETRPLIKDTRLVNSIISDNYNWGSTAGEALEHVLDTFCISHSSSAD